MNTSQPSGQLPFRVKICYSVGGFGKSLPTVMLMAYSLYFYTDLCGIDPMIASVVILLARIWDFLNDPIMGILVDRTRSHIGRCRIWLRYFSLPAGIAFGLCFIMPDFGPTGKIIWFALFYVLQDMVGTAVLVPINTMLGRITHSDVERAGISAWNGVFGLIANLVGGSMTMPLVAILGGGDEIRGFAWVGVIYGLLFALSNYIVYWGTKGYDPIDEPQVGGDGRKIKEDHAPAGEAIKALLANRPWLMCVGMYFVIMVSSGIYSSASLFYFQYNLGNVALYSTINALSLFISLASYIFFQPAVKRFGCAKLGMIGGVVMFACFLGRFLLQDATSWILVLGSIFGTFGQSMATSTIMLMVLDSGIYGEWKYGVKHEAVLISGYSVSYKVGSTITTPIAGFLLGVVPYVEGADTQVASVLNLFFFENTLLPAIGGALAVIFAYGFLRYERRFPDMRREVARRKAQQREQEVLS